MNTSRYKKYIAIGITAFSVIAASILLVVLFWKSATVIAYLKKLSGILMPFMIGGVIAYLLAPIYNWLLKNTDALLRRRIKSKNRARHIAVVVAMFGALLFGILLIGGIVALVLPQFLNSIMGLVQSLPEYVTQVTNWINNFFKDNPALAATVEDYMTSGVQSVEQWVTQNIAPNLEAISGTVGNVSSIVGVLASGVIIAVKAVKNLILGVIVAAYLLVEKGMLIGQTKRVIYGMFHLELANAIVEKFRYVHKVFGGFIMGKLVDSLIISCICFVGVSLLQMPYAMLISVIIGVTNIVPFFGPFIGAIPCGCLILLYSPLKCLYFAIFILALQQFDGNILGPKILGNTTGLSSLWVLFAILLFGGLWGFAGMILGVPVFAVIYSLVTASVEQGLKKRKLSLEAEDYHNLHKVHRHEDGTFSYPKDPDPTIKK